MIIGLTRVSFGLKSNEWLQNLTTAKWESDLLITSMITDRNGQYEVLLTINHNYYNFRKEQMNWFEKGLLELIIWDKNSSSLEIRQFWRVSGYCYGYCYLCCDWLTLLCGLSKIGCFNCSTTGVRLRPIVRLKLYRIIRGK